MKQLRPLFFSFCVLLALCCADKARADINSSSVTPTGTFPSYAPPDITLTANVTFASGVRNVTGFIYQDGGEYDGVGMTNVGGNVWKVAFGSGELVPNTTTVAQTFTFQIVASDNAGDTVTQDVPGTIVLAPNTDFQPPVITDPSITPTGTFSATQPPSIAVTATVTDDGPNDTGVEYVYANLYRGGNYVTTIYLTADNSGDPYTGTFPASALGVNTTQDAQTYTVIVFAQDREQNTGQADVPGSVKVQANTEPLLISNTSLSPAVLPHAGGALSVSAVVLGDLGVATVTGVLFRDGTKVDTLALGHSNGVYSRTFPASDIPDAGAGSHTYKVVIIASTFAGATASVTRYAVQPGTAAYPAPTLTGITPAEAFTHTTVSIALTGTGFVAGASVVLWDGQVLIPDVLSPTTLSVVVSRTYLTQPGRVSVSVYNPLPSGGTSGALTFTVKPRLRFVKVPAQVVGGIVASGMVSLAAPAFSDQTVTLASSDPAVTVPASVFVLAGRTSASFPIFTRSVGTSLTVTITGTLESVKTGVLTLHP